MNEMIERVAVALAKANGGDFYDPNFYTEEQRNVWRTKARDGIEAMISTTELAANDDQCLANLVRTRFCTVLDN